MPRFSFRASLALAVLLSAADANAEETRVTIYPRQRPEVEQNIPLSLTTLTREALERDDIDSPVTLGQKATGLSFNNPFGRYNASPAMRGLAQPGIGEETTTAFFQDGVYVAGRSSVDMLLFDLERVEIARGPQNALYGRNSFGGAVNYVSRLPGSRPRVQAAQSLGTSGHRTTFAAAEGALVPGRVEARLAGTLIQRGATYDNTASFTTIGQESSGGLKLTLRARPDSLTELVFRSALATDDDTQPRGFLVAANCEPRSSDSQLRQYCGTLPHAGSTLQADAYQDYGFRRAATRHSLHIERQLPDDLTLTLLGGVNSEDSTFSRDDDYAASVAQISGAHTDRADYSVEARLRSPAREDGLTWLGGVSYFRFDNITQRQDQAVILGVPTPGGARSASVHESVAGFGSLSHPVGGGFVATVDARWQIERKTLKSSIVALSTGRPLRLAESWESFTPRFTLSRKLTPTIMAYASAAQGYKSGGFNDRANIYESERRYDPETNWTWETGLKSAFWQERLVANLTVFRVDWRDQQIVAYSAAGVNNNFYTTNAGRSVSQGVELHLAARPSPSWNLRLDYSFADARFVDYKDGELAALARFGPDGDVSRHLIPRYSPHQLVAGADYETPLDPGTGLKGFAGTTLSFQSRQAADVSNLSFTGDDVKWNLRAGLARGPLRLTLWADNVLDDRTPLAGVRWQDATKGYARAWLVIPPEGRVIGARLAVDWEP